MTLWINLYRLRKILKKMCVELHLITGKIQKIEKNALYLEKRKDFRKMEKWI